MIGPTFPSELAAAGLLGLPFAWGPDGDLEFSPGMSANQRGAVLAVLAAHDPARLPVPTPEEARSAALEAMQDIPAYLPALDSLIATVAKDPRAPDTITDAAAVLQEAVP